MLKTSASALATAASLVLSTATFARLSAVPAAPPPPPATSPIAAPPVVGPPLWVPPPWLTDGGDVSPLALADLGAPDRFDDGPSVRSRAAFVANLDTGEVLWSRRADERFPVASLTKMVAALTLIAEEPGVDLSRPLCVGPEQYPTASGARSRFVTGACHEGWDWLGAALVASDNRGAMGLPSLAGARYSDFVEAMNRVSGELGMGQSTWSDPTGIEIDDMSTARDMARAVTALAAHPLLSTVASSDSWTIERRDGPQTLGSTNKLVHAFETLAAKTGYTDPAGYCFATVVRAEHTRLVSVVLGAPTSAARFADTTKLIRWALHATEAAGSRSPAIAMVP